MLPRHAGLGLAKSARAAYADTMMSPVVSSRLALIPLLGLTIFFPFLQGRLPVFRTWGRRSRARMRAGVGISRLCTM